VRPSELYAHGLTLEQAAERASFAVFALRDLPEGPWKLVAAHSKAHREVPEWVSLLYHRRDGRGQIHVRESAGGSDDRFGSFVEGAQVVVERDGTRVALSSEEHGEDELRALAETLARA
jgi:hypothetical protein